MTLQPGTLDYGAIVWGAVVSGASFVFDGGANKFLATIVALLTIVVLAQRIYAGCQRHKRMRRSRESRN